MSGPPDAPVRNRPAPVLTGHRRPSHLAGLHSAPLRDATPDHVFTTLSPRLDLPRQRWVALLTNRVHPRREDTTDAIRTLRRAVGDAAVTLLGE